ncbi:chemoreceptor glutamine deamidase CheD [Fulvimonas soli]|jgi:chemotaxis protein CheD|uniref:Probable chemoreceptor glutamine deamidase CheD n=1 Tax=Fulvimonas soli TaxID=155197 RepID=A0A316HM44_9GAMM|nr:chemoreceptor glutamine deamidase CheD [Fulvimonas soli]PWK81086.1 chemotaxis protein CheD [Fulvimonas soli]TNY26241.1 chemotaxis protein CheD [Fulvimonas soli]
MNSLAAKLDHLPVLPGFEHLRRFWDSTHNCPTVKVLPGEFYVSGHEEVVSTVLGSCVSACIYDPRRRLGGMNHFMLPAPSGEGARERDDWTCTVGRAARYGNDAMEQLINAILKAGGQRADLEVKIFGGGRVLAQMTDVGRRNIEFVQHYIETERLKLVAADVGDVYPRQVQFFPASGKVRVRQLKRAADAGVVAEEKQYLKRLANDPIKGEVELF